MLVDISMICIFLKMYIHFLKSKRRAMEEKMIKWKCKNTIHVIGVLVLVFLDLSRTIIEVISP